MVEGSGLENRRACERTVGSNPTLSAIFFTAQFNLLVKASQARVPRSCRRTDAALSDLTRQMIFGGRVVHEGDASDKNQR